MVLWQTMTSAELLSTPMTLSGEELSQLAASADSTAWFSGSHGVGLLASEKL